MAKLNAPSTVLTVRVSREIDRQLARHARRQRTTRSDVARAILEAGLSRSTDDQRAEAKRQSQLASARASERETLRWIAAIADLRGWK